MVRYEKNSIFKNIENENMRQRVNITDKEVYLYGMK